MDDTLEWNTVNWITDQEWEVRDSFNRVIASGNTDD